MAHLLLCGSACRLLGQEALRRSKAVPRGELREGPAALRLVARCFWRAPIALHMVRTPQCLAIVCKIRCASPMPSVHCLHAQWFRPTCTL